jgi:hypothetical protein
MCNPSSRSKALIATHQNPAPAGFFISGRQDGEDQMGHSLDGAALDQLFDKVRTNKKWQPRDVPDELLRNIVEQMKWGPTSANCTPARFVFYRV